MMERKQICEFLVQNEVPGELMAYADLGDQGCAAIASNGMKFTFSADYLAQAESKAEAARSEASPQKQSGSKPAAKPPGRARGAAKRKPPTRRKPTTRRKPATRSKKASTK